MSFHSPRWAGPLVLLALMLGLRGPGARAEQISEPDPAAYRAGVMRNPNLKKYRGEVFCWHAAYGANDFLAAYEAFKNPKWLEEAEKYYGYFISKLEKDPDGYEGWIGPTVNNMPEIKGDALVGDAILCEPLVKFAEIVLAEPALKKRWGATAQKYIALSTRIIWEKWNKRGCYYENEAGWGSYHTHDKYIDAKTGKWVARPGLVISDNLNKHYSAAHVILRLWRLTGKPEYRERVLKVYGRAKAMWRYFKDEDRIVWNFWMPHGPYDIEGKAPKSWVAVHPSRAGYQAGEVSDWVEVYDSGLVFEKADLERIIRTNHWMIQTGAWRSADGASKAGTLWSALARFDKPIRERYEAGLRKKPSARNKIALAYLKNVTEKRLGWKRLYVKDESQVKVLRPPLQAGRNISMALVIPDVVETVNNAKVKLVTQTRAKGTLKIELLDAAGKKVLGELFKTQTPAGAEYHAPRWDGTNPKTGKKELGKYRIRWTLAGESRGEPVWVKLGTKREKTGPALLKPGGKIVTDFEGKPDPHWRLEGARLSEEQAHGGKKSLKLIKGNKAELVFGEDDDLPVRVTMWIYDAGRKLGKKGASGPAWGVKTAGGDKFCLRTCWRRYLSGDTEYAWFNTGENQWFNPNPARIKRKSGWAKWIFDFSNPKAVRVSGAGAALGNVKTKKKYLPKGAAAVYLLGGDPRAGALYVDDVTVEYPKP